MEKREKRDTTQWLNASPNSPKPTANYDTSNQKIKKESFNYGQVPFGSHSKQQFLYQTRVTHNMPEVLSPGPGSYGNAISPRDDSQVMGRKLSPGYSFSKIGLAKNGSGTREMLFNGQKPSQVQKPPIIGGMISKTRKNSSVQPAALETGNSFSREVSLMSLR